MRKIRLNPEQQKEERLKFCSHGDTSTDKVKWVLQCGEAFMQVKRGVILLMAWWYTDMLT